MNNFIIDDIKNSFIKLVNKTNIKYENYKLKTDLKELYILLGKKVYNHSQNKTISELKLDNIFKQINDLKNKIANVGIIKCFNCTYTTNKDEVFCPNCGYKLKI